MPKFCFPCSQASTSENFNENDESSSSSKDKKISRVGRDLEKPTAAEYAGQSAKEFLTILEAVAQQIPVPGVAAAVGIATNLIKACEEGQATLEKAEELKLRIKTLVTVLVNETKGKKADQIQESLRKDIVDLQNDLKYIEKILNEITSQHALLLIFFRNFNGEKVQRCMSRLDVSLEKFNISRQLDYADILNRLEKQVVAFYEEQKKALDHIQEVVDGLKLTMEDVKAILKNNLAAATGASSTSTRPSARAIIPASTRFFYGRDASVKDLVHFLTNAPSDKERHHVCILGPGGMGKTSTALTVMSHAETKKVYPRGSQVWVPCVKAKSVPLFYDTLSSSLGITQSTGSVRDNILSVLRLADRLVLLLDNFETPWNVDEGRAEMEQILRDIDQMSHVTLFITMRSSAPPCRGLLWHSLYLKAVDAHASHQIYSAIHPEGSSDSGLPELLQLVGHMPLAVTLIATYASLTGLSAHNLAEQYRKVGTTMLGQGSDAEHSMDVCISLSVDSAPMKRRPEAFKLLAALAMLPVGTTYDMLISWWARRMPNVAGSLEVLLETSLLERRGSTFFVLPVIQHYILDPSRFPEDVRMSMFDSACDFLAQHKSSPGDSMHKIYSTASNAEESNLEAVLLQAKIPSPQIINALLSLAEHQASTRPRVTVVDHAVHLVLQMENNESLHAAVLFCYGIICHNIDRYEDSRIHFSHARELFLSEAVRDISQAARCLLEAVKSYQFDYTTPIEVHSSLIAQAQEEFESIGHAHGVALCWYYEGISLRQYSSNEKALELFGRAKDTFAELNDPLRVAQCSWNIATSYFWLGKYEEAEDWANASMHIYVDIGPSDGDIDAAMMLGRILNARAKYADALAVLFRCLEKSKVSGSPVNTGFALEEMGRAWAKLGKKEDARASFQEALQVLPSLPHRGDVIRCRYFLRKVENPEVNATPQEEVEISRFYGESIENLV